MAQGIQLKEQDRHAVRYGHLKNVLGHKQTQRDSISVRDDIATSA